MAMKRSRLGMTRASSTSITVDALFCACHEPTCGGDFMLGCGGEVLPFYAGMITAARRTSRETCLVCGCAGLEPVELRATAVCAGL
jgi:hypothetical protein